MAAALHPALWLPVWLVAVPWGLRALLLSESAARPAAADLRGFAADAGAALIAAALAALAAHLPGRLRWGAVLPAAAWVLLAFAGYEHVRALGAPLELTYAGYLADRTFLFGSALAPSRPWLLALALLAAAGLAAALAVGLAAAPRSRRRAAVLGPALAGVVLAAASLAVPEDPRVLAWRQRSPLVSRLAPAAADLPADIPADLLGVFTADLSGELRPGLGAGGGERPNVLLVILEGVSGAYLPSLEPEGSRAAGPAPMPGLDAVAARSTAVGTFLAQQRQTNRGEYALLCGDLPELTTREPRLSRLARGELDGSGCLPALLGRHGWATVYLQAAPLAFMLKDRAMAAMGFDRVEGEEVFPRGGTRGLWGVDDRTFFEQALARVRSLEAERRSGGGPWFLTLLTSGTHHPYTLPEEEAAGGEPSLGAAMAALDRAVTAFVAALEAERVLEDTLVVLTSDESAGWSGSLAAEATEDTDRALSQSRGLLLLLGAGSGAGDRGVGNSGVGKGGGLRIEEPYLQSDLSLSLLDLLGLLDGPGGASAPSGRSLRRRDAEPRPLPFANTYLGRVGLLEGGHLLWCDEAVARCQAWRVDPRDPLGPRRTAVEPEAPVLRRLRGLVALDRLRHPRGSAAAASPVTLDLLAPAVVVVHDADAPQMILGGQSLDVPAGRHLEVELDLAVEGGPGWLHLRHALASGGGYLARPSLPVLAAGDRLRLRYGLTAAEPLAGLEVRLVAKRLLGSGLALRFERARLTLAPVSPNGQEAEAGEPGRVRVEELSADRAAPPPVLRLGWEDVADPLPACVRRRGDGLRAEGCPLGEVLAGPRFYAPEGSRVEARYALEGVAGEVALTALVGSESPSLVLAEGRLPRLAAGERRALSVTARVERVSLDELRLGLFAKGAGSFDIHDLAVEVRWP